MLLGGGLVGWAMGMEIGDKGPGRQLLWAKYNIFYVFLYYYSHMYYMHYIYLIFFLRNLGYSTEYP